VNKPIPTGSSCLDQNLQGGIAAEAITLVYGEAETGKSTLALQCAAFCALQGQKTLYVDCDSTFAPERLSQITGEKFQRVADNLVLVRPKDFVEQTALIDNLPDYIGKGFGLVVLDTFNSLYRARVAETATKPKVGFELNRELNRQMALLAQAAKTQHIAIIAVSQVKAVFDNPHVDVAPVATRVLEFWAETTIALKPTENPATIKATVKRNRNPQEATCYLMITQKGIHDIKRP
jgi:DNA repair protein RadB